jgi:hypothetical protein
MSDQLDLSDDLLRGGKVIAKEIYGKDDRKHIRKIYHEQNKFPIFQLDDSGVLYALRSRLRAHLEAKSAEKEARIAAASKITGKTTAQPPRRRRRARPTKTAA